MSFSSSSCTSHSDEQQDTIDVENDVGGESCPDDLIRGHAVRKIIFDRGFMDGINMGNLLQSELRSVNASNESVEVVAMIDITNAAIIADVAVMSSLIALEAANLAVDLAIDPTKVTEIEVLVKVALDSMETTEIMASVARSKCVEADVHLVAMG
ncbi:hypothetical protein QTP88_011810 [Uroleucon formosanum]